MGAGLRVGLTGHIRCGKDTVAGIFVKKYNFYRMGIADNIKWLCNYVYPKQMNKGKNGKLQQQVALDLRKYDEDVWLKLLLKKIKAEVAPEANIIVTDIRYPKEYKELKKLGFFIIT